MHSVQSNDFINLPFSDDLLSQQRQARQEQDKKSQQTSKITTLLRGCGSLLIIISAIIFLVQGAEGLLPVFRYWVALGFVLILSLSGVVCAYCLKESKGARLFFALSCVFLAVQASQLSAMLGAYLYGDVEYDLQQVFSWWQFGDVTLAILLLNLGVTIFLSAPIVFATFSLLARTKRKQLSLGFVIANCALLLPFRDAYFIPVLIAALLIYLRFINIRLTGDNRMRLQEGVTARMIIWVPALIIIGRSFLYPASFLLPMVLLGMISLWLLHDVKKGTHAKRIIFCAEVVGVGVTMLAWFCVIDRFVGQVQLGLLVLPMSLILFMIAQRLTYHAHLYRAVASLLVVWVTYHLEFSGWIVPVVCMTSGLLLLIASIKYREKMPAVAGVSCFISGLLYYVHYITHFYQASPWLSSVALGVLVLLLASYIESREKQIIQKTRDYFTELKEWK